MEQSSSRSVKSSLFIPSFVVSAFDFRSSATSALSVIDAYPGLGHFKPLLQPGLSLF